MNRTVRGIVVRETPCGENGKLLYVLTDSEGVLCIMARGARKISASYLKSAQLFAYSDLTVYDKGGHLTLTEATLIESFFAIRADVYAFAFASYACEIAHLSAVVGDDTVLRLLLNTLYAAANKLCDIPLLKAVFEFRFCVLSGMAPDFNSCSVCGAAADAFDFLTEEPVCNEHLLHPNESFRLSRPVLRALDYLGQCTNARMLSFTLDEDSLNQFTQFAEKFFLLTTDLKPKSLEFYHSL